MRLANWNVARPVPSGQRRRASIVEQIEMVAADIWVLTETHDSVVPGSSFQGISTEGDDRPAEPGERWVTIWSRFPIEALPPTSDPVRTVAARVVPHRSAPLVVYGTVLPWLGSAWRDVEAVDGKAFAAALDVQTADWCALRESFPDDDLVVAGDFNQDLADTRYYGSRANRAKLESALQRAGLVALTARGDDPIRALSAPSACIDHICISAPSHWRSTGAHRWPDTPSPDRRLSDHFGVVVTFEPAIMPPRTVFGASALAGPN